MLLEDFVPVTAQEARRLPDPLSLQRTGAHHHLLPTGQGRLNRPSEHGGVFSDILQRHGAGELRGTSD